MEEKSRFAQILIFWDAVLLGTLIFISLSVKPGLRCLWLHSAMLAECAIGLLILGILTFGKSEPDIVHGRLFTVMIGGISLQLVLYYDQPLILHTFLLILMLTITIYRNFSLCKFAMVEMMVLYLLSVLYYWNVGFGDNVSVMYSVVAAGGVLGGSFILSCILGTEEKNRRIIRENRQTSIDMLRLVEMKKEEAEHLAEVKSVFLANMSHEIRTPMNAIVGLTEIAKHYEEDPKKIEDYLDKIDVSSKVLLNIINDILDMSSIENKKMKIAKEPFDLHEILMSVCTIYEPQCKQKGIAFEVQDEEVTHTHLIGDGLRVNQILLNLVSNAYKFTPSGGKITIKVKELYVKEEKAYFNFLVEDTGEGMSEEMQTRLFQPFEQESATTAQKHGGSGLGLSIAKNFVELMSGSISVKSKKGEGTTFVVSIPFEFEQAAEPEITEQPVENDLSVVQEEQAVYDFTGKKVLLAEDTAFNEEVATELLAMVHMDVDCAHNGKEAVELFEKAKPGTYMAILMDIHMPVMNGYEAARTIRKSEREDAGTIAIYAMTANSFEEDVSAALNAGMNGHIAKPIDAQILYEVLDKLAKEQQ